jgi:hypothetical protein
LYINFVKKPNEGTEGAKLWDLFDAKLVSTGRSLTVDHAVGIAQRMETNEGNARIEFRDWQTFHGVIEASSWQLKTLEAAKSQFATSLRKAIREGTDTREAWKLVAS